MLRSPHDRAIFALALPALGSLAIDPLVGLVDTAFVARLGDTELGALGVCNGLFGLAFFVFNFLAYGTTPLVAEADASGDRARVGRVVGQALALAFALGLAGACVLELAASPLLRWMGASDALLDASTRYLRARAWAMPAVLVITAANGAYRGVSDTRTPLYVALVLNGINLVLDPWMIFGLGLGIAGAGFASAIAQWVGALLFLGALLGWHRDRFQVPWRLPSLPELTPLLAVGGTLSIRTFAMVGTLTLATATAARIGEAAVGAHQVGWQLWGASALIVDALAVAGQALVARHLETRPRIARQIADRLCLWGVLVGCGLSLALAASTPLIGLLLVETPDAAAALDRIWWMIVGMQPLNALVFVWDGVYLGAKRFRFLAISMVLAGGLGGGLLIAVPWAGWGLGGVWAALVGINLVRATALGLGYLRWPGAGGRAEPGREGLS